MADKIASELLNSGIEPTELSASDLESVDEFHFRGKRAYKVIATIRFLEGTDMGFENITVRVENHVGWLEYNRPPVNAVHWEMLREMPQAVQSLLEDDDVRVIVFASALEKYFSTGADLQVFAEIDAEGMREWMTIVHTLVKTLRASRRIS